MILSSCSPVLAFNHHLLFVRLLFNVHSLMVRLVQSRPSAKVKVLQRRNGHSRCWEAGVCLIEGHRRLAEPVRRWQVEGKSLSFNAVRGRLSRRVGTGLSHRQCPHIRCSLGRVSLTQGMLFGRSVKSLQARQRGRSRFLHVCTDGEKEESSSMGDDKVPRVVLIDNK